MRRRICSVCSALVLVLCFAVSAHASDAQLWAEKWDEAVADRSVISLSPGADETEMRFRFLTAYGEEVSFRLADRETLTQADALPVRRTPTVTGRICCTVSAENLRRDTTYYYAYAVNGKWRGVYSFHTAGDTLTALFVSDSQLGRSGDWRDKDVLLHDVAGWDTTLQEATRLNPDISLCLSAGDQAEIGFSEKQYRLLLAPEVMRSLPIATTIGNHEFYFPCLNLHFAHPNRFGGSILHSLGDEPYYFMQNNVLFIVLDTNDPIAWDHEIVLDHALRAYPDAGWRVVLMHHSLYSCEDTFEDGPALRAKLVPLLQKYGVDLVLSGHTHRFSRSFPLLNNEIAENGITYLEGGCCSGCNCKASPQPLPSYSAAGYPQTNPVYSVLQFTHEELAIRSFAVEDGQSVQIDSVTLSPHARDDAQAHASGLVRVLQGVLCLLGRAVSVVFV